MIWRKREDSDDGKALANRLASVLGVSLEEGAAPEERPSEFEGGSNGNVKSNETTVKPMEAPPSHPPVATETQPKSLETPGVSPVPRPPWQPVEGWASKPHALMDEPGSSPRPATTRFGAEPWHAPEPQSSSLDADSVAAGAPALSRSMTLSDGGASRQQSSRAQTEEMISALNSTLTRFSRDTHEAAQTQIRAFEERLTDLFAQNLAAFSAQVASRTQAGVEAVSSRVEATRAQSEKMNAALLATMARFNEQTEQAAKSQASSFEEKLTALLNHNLATFSGQIEAQTKAGLAAVSAGVEGLRSEAGEISAELQAALSRFNEQSQLAAKAQLDALDGKLSGLFDQNVSKISTQIASQAEAGVAAVKGQVEGAHTQAAEISAALQATLSHFTEQSRQAAQEQFEALESKLAGLFDQNLGKFSQQVAAQTETGAEAVAGRVESARSQADEIGLALQATLTHFSEQTREAAEAQTKAFEERLNRLTEQAASRTQAGVKAVFGQVETSRSQVAEMNAALQATLAQFRAETGAATLSHTKAVEERLTGLFEENLDKFSDRIASRTQAGLDAVSHHVEKTRLHAEKLNASLQSTLAGFTQQAEASAAGQTRTFEKRLSGLLEQYLGKFSEQISAQTKAGLDAAAKRASGSRAQAEEAQSALQTILSKFSREAEETARKQRQAFEERLNKVAEQLARTEARLESASAKTKGGRLEAEEANRVFEAGLERFAARTQEAAQAQTAAFQKSLSALFEQNLATFSKELAAQALSSQNAASSRLSETRSQAEAVNAALESTLGQFAEKARKAGQAQTEAFAENLGKIAEQFTGRSQTVFEGLASRLEATRVQAEAMNSALETTLGKFTEKTRRAGQAQTEAFAENIGKIAEQFAGRSQAVFEGVANRLDGARVQAEAVNATLESTLAQFAETTRKATDTQTRAFEQSLSKIAEQFVTQSQSGLESVTSRLEGARSQAEAMNTALESTLAHFAEKTSEAGQTQAQAFEENLGKIAAQIVAQSQTGLEGVSTRLESTRAQAEAMNSALESTLAQFAENTRDAAQRQTEAFEQRLGEIASRIEASTQAGLEGLSNQVADTRVQAEAVTTAVGSALTHFTRTTQEATQSQTKAFQLSLAKICRDVIAQTQKELEGLTQRVESARAQAEQTNTAVEEALKRFKQNADKAPQGKAAPEAAPTGWLANPPMRYAAMGLGAVALVAVVAGLGVLLSGGLGHPRLYEVPATYHGWVLARYKDPSCPPLTSSGIYSVVQVSASGDACTSNPLPEGIQNRKFEAVKSTGTRAEMQDLGWDPGSKVRFLGASSNGEYELFFVGSNDELNRSWASMPTLPGLDASDRQPPAATRARSSRSARASN